MAASDALMYTVPDVLPVSRPVMLMEAAGSVKFSSSCVTRRENGAHWWICRLSCSLDNASHTHDAGLWAQVSLNDVGALCHPNTLLTVWTETCTKVSCWRSLCPALAALLLLLTQRSSPAAGADALLVVLSCSRFAAAHFLVSPPQSVVGELANLLSTAQWKTPAAVKTEKSGMKDKERAAALAYTTLFCIW